jgi:hypothetical protein
MDDKQWTKDRRPILISIQTSFLNLSKFSEQKSSTNFYFFQIVTKNSKNISNIEKDSL